MEKLKLATLTLALCTANIGCSIPKEVIDLMDSQPPTGEANSFSYTEDLERVISETIHKEQPPPL